ncbi:MAG: hypothetical protein ACRD3T_03785 [Terriglobia bacterium]
MKGFWTASIAILIWCGTAAAGPMNPCGMPPALDSTSDDFPAFSQMAGCVRKTLDPVDGTFSFAPSPALLNPAIRVTQASPFSSPVPPLALQNLATEKFASPTDGLNSASPSNVVLKLSGNSDSNRSSSRPAMMTVTLLGVGVFVLACLMAVRRQRGKLRGEVEGRREMASGLPAPHPASAEVLISKPAEEILQASTRRCRYCTSALVRPSQKRNLLESRVLPLLSIIPFRCMSCRRRYYGLAFSR